MDFFRANSLTDALVYVRGLCKPSLFSLPTILPYSIFGLLFFFILVEWLGRENQYALQRFGFKWPKPVRLSFYYGVLFLIFIFMGKEQVFIYFQF